ncbi:MAG: TraM recognition domain-containing protein [Pseudomonadota bacterium]|nr:TraM recognition domain-containing protein [Pseudomonadota bacterium]
MIKPRFRGVTEAQEQNQANLVRDIRPVSQKIYDFISKSEHAALIVILIGVGGFLVPSLANFLILFMGIIFVLARFKHTHLPFRMPMRSMDVDYYDQLPNGKYGLAKGIYYFGNSIEDGAEMWFSDEDMRTHCLVFGSTGSGKTVTLSGLAYNALVQASGFIYIDGKGDNTLFSRLFSMAKFMGREDDLLLINFMTGARDIIGAQEKKLSNTMNPFSTGSSSMLSNLVSSMLDSGSGGGDGDMWKGRAIAFVEALFKLLVYQRDAGNIMLDADTIRNYFALDRLEAIVADKVFIRDGQFDISLEGTPDLVMQPLTNYLTTLPGYVKERKGKQVSQVYEQHGFITMQLTRTFGTFADTYGHIMRTRLGEVDMKDVVLNRRILIVLLPALEKSPDELANLGKIVIATLKGMMASGLGDSVEGTYQDVITRKPTNAPTPFLCVMDEYGYYAVKGFAVVPAQARSLGFACVFAGQDLPAFQKASKEEAASIGANTNIKICMKLEDPTDTWEFFMKSAGDAYVTSVESFSSQNQGMSGSYMDTKTAKAEKRSRIDLLDLKDQGVGQGHVFFKSQIVRADLLFFDPPAVKAMRLNVFLKVDLPKDSDMYTIVKSIEDYEALVSKGSLPELQAQEDEAIDAITQAVQAQLPNHATSIDLGLNVLFEQHKQSVLASKTTEPNTQGVASSDTASELPSLPDSTASQSSQEIDMPVTDSSKVTQEVPMVSTDCDSVDVFTVVAVDQSLSSIGEISLLIKKDCIKQMVYTIKLMGKPEKDANQMAEKCILGLIRVSTYRDCNIENFVTVDQLNDNIRALTELFNDT